MVVTVLSQFCTLTVCNAISMTKPSAPAWGISIQSPMRSISLEVICALATSESKVSLNTSSNTADKAPRPDSINKGERLTRMEMIKMTHTAQTMILRSEEHTSELQSLMRISYAV